MACWEWEQAEVLVYSSPPSVGRLSQKDIGHYSADIFLTSHGAEWLWLNASSESEKAREKNCLVLLSIGMDKS